MGLGSSIVAVLCSAYSFLLIRIKKIPLHLRLYAFRFGELLEALKQGFPTSGNNLADGMVSDVVNNMIVRGFGGNATALAVYTAVKSVFNFTQTTVTGPALATGPLFGVLYGARDKNGLREGYKVGPLFSVVWCALLVALLPVLQKFYGMSGNSNVRTCVLVCFLFVPFFLTISLTLQLFESTEKAGMGILYSIIPDSIRYPILLLLLTPHLGCMGIWLTFGSNVPMLDISIRANGFDITNLSAQVHAFLERENIPERTSYIVALCLEELAADFAAHCKEIQTKASDREIMDIKIFSDEASVRLIIRNMSKAYNLLNFDPSNDDASNLGIKMAQQFAHSIDYSYVYKINIVTIALDK